MGCTALQTPRCWSRRRLSLRIRADGADGADGFAGGAGGVESLRSVRQSSPDVLDYVPDVQLTQGNGGATIPNR
jgi:hypothetical protein